MNKKGFVITGLIYSVLILFLVILFGMLAILANRRGQLNTLVKNISKELSVSYDKPIINYGPTSGSDAWNKYNYLIINSETTGFLSKYITAKDKDGNSILSENITFKVGGTPVVGCTELNHGDLLIVTAKDPATDITTTTSKTIYKPEIGLIYEYGPVSKPLSYVSGDEFIRHYDGINNSDTGHSTTATSWKNLRDTTNHGIINNIVQSDGTSGWTDNGLEFDGINDYVQMPITGNFPNLTFEITFYNDAVNNVTSSNAITWSSGKNTIIIYGSTAEGTKKNAYIASNTGELSVGTVFLNSNATKYTYSVVYDTTTQKATYYINGALAKQVNLPTNSTSFSLAGQYIFANKNATFFRKGIVYSVRMYNKALTAEEIKQNYDMDNFRFKITE